MIEASLWIGGGVADVEIWTQWEEVILSEQMGVAAINAIMLEHHDFADWLKARARKRLMRGQHEQL